MVIRIREDIQHYLANVLQVFQPCGLGENASRLEIATLDEMLPQYLRRAYWPASRPLT